MPLVPGPGQLLDVLGVDGHGRRERPCLSRFFPSSCLLAPVGRPSLPKRTRPTRSEFPCPTRMPLTQANSLDPRGGR
jgi:hypothetical protein